MFKNIDKKFEEIGFIKTEENEYQVIYERENEFFNFTQVLAICCKASGKHIVQSYDRDLFDRKGIGNTCVGLTYYEMKLVSKKMRKLGWHKTSK